jgi:hypothetical protein
MMAAIDIQCALPSNGLGFSRVARDAMMAQIGRQERSGPRRLHPELGVGAYERNGLSPLTSHEPFKYPARRVPCIRQRPRRSGRRGDDQPWSAARH